MKKVIFVFTVGLLLSACSSEANKNDNKNPENTSENVENKVEVKANRMLTMEVDGMVCQMGCGGSIRKELKALGGVSAVEFDFEDERKTNIAKISFDKNLVSVDEMIAAVSSINEGQFTIGKTSSEDIHEVTSSEETTSSSSETPAVEMNTSKVALPNLFDLFSGFLIN